MSVTTYRTTCNPVVRARILRNLALLAVSVSVMLWLWLTYGGLLNAVLLGINGLAFVWVLFVLIRVRTPLSIEQDHVVISPSFKMRLPLANIEGIGLHSVRQVPCLLYQDDRSGKTGEIIVPWNFIAEPQAEVVEKLQDAIDAYKTQ